MSLYSDTLLGFRAILCLILLIHGVYLAEKQQMPIV
jgi:hypothetical protein